MKDSLYDMRWVAPLKEADTKDEIAQSFFSRLLDWGFKKVSEKEYIKNTYTDDSINIDTKENTVEFRSNGRLLYSGPVEFAEEIIGRFYN